MGQADGVPVEEGTVPSVCFAAKSPKIGAISYGNTALFGLVMPISGELAGSGPWTRRFPVAGASGGSVELVSEWPVSWFDSRVW